MIFYCECRLDYEWRSHLFYLLFVNKENKQIVQFTTLIHPFQSLCIIKTLYQNILDYERL